MTVWTHALCSDCFTLLEPGREPYRVGRDVEVCCNCGNVTRSGIYYRVDDEMNFCRGSHDDDLR